MSDKEKHLLFMTILVLIVLVNLILIYALFAHFALGRKIVEINWLLTVVAAEFVGCTAVAWRKIINSEAAPHTKSCEPIVIEKRPVPGDPNDAGATLLEMGRRLLTEARDCKKGLKARKQFARRALQLFAQIPKGHPAYHMALFNSATAYRILGEYDKAISTYLKVGKLVRASGSKYTIGERCEWDANVEMMIGTVYKDQGQLDLAQSCFFNSWKLDPNNLVRMLNLHEVAAKLGQHEDARIWADMLSKHPSYSSSIARVVENQSTPPDAPNDDAE